MAADSSPDQQSRRQAEMSRRRVITAAAAAAGGGVIGAGVGGGIARGGEMNAFGAPSSPPEWANGFFRGAGTGIDPTGREDSTEALQRLLDAAQEAGGTVVLPAGTFRVSSLVTSESFSQPSIVGAGSRATVLFGSDVAPVIALTGGSGQLTGARISDLTIRGDRAVGIELRGASGVSVERVLFESLATGVLFHNASPGSFTEMNVLARCVFEDSVQLPIEYRRSEGDASCHGSGFLNCVFVQRESQGGPLVHVGAGCLVYNAPWDATVFANGPSPLIRNDGEREVSTSGVLRIESSRSAAGCTVVDPESREPVYYAGELLYFGSDVVSGDKFWLVYSAQFNADGSLTAIRKPYTKEVLLSTGTTAVLPVDNSAAATVSVTVVGSDYTHNELLYVFRDPYSDEGTVTTLAVGSSFDRAGYGPPSYDFMQGRLVITNPRYPESGVTARLGVAQLGSRTPFPLL